MWSNRIGTHLVETRALGLGQLLVLHGLLEPTARDKTELGIRLGEADEDGIRVRVRLHSSNDLPHLGLGSGFKASLLGA